MSDPIALGYAQPRSKPVNPARVVNLYPEPAPEGSRAKVVHYGTPGQKAWTKAGTQTIRAHRYALGALYALSGDTLYRIDAGGAVSVCSGDPISPTGIAMMSDNGLQLVVLSNKESFVVVGTTVTKITSAGYPAAGASSVDYIDGYTVWTEADTGEWFISDLLDSSTIDPLDFATAESSPDGLLRVLIDHREVWLFGTNTIEPWTNTGASPFPFERVSGAILERGTAAALSPAKMDNSVFWLGDDRMVYRAEGYQPTRISNHAVEEVLRTGEVSDAYGMTYSQGGHHFYVLTMPSKGRTFAYDAATQLWHERQSGTALTPEAWNVQCITQAYGKTLAGVADGNIVELDLDTYTDLGEPIRSVISTPPLFPEGRRAIMSEVEIDCERGVGLTSDLDPQLMLRWSDDGGNTWSNQRTQSLGKLGVRNNRVAYHNLGAFRQRTLEFSITDPVKRAFYGARYTAKELGR